MTKKTRGRQKIPMAKISHRSNLQVTFSKRRAGLFKKASEISTLCGAEVAMIVFSPADKAFSFGNPSVDSVVERFLEGGDNSSLPPEMMMMKLMQEERSNAIARDQNLQLDHILSLLALEQRRSAELDRAREGGLEWWRGSSEELTLDQLEQLKGLLLGLKRNIECQIERVVVQMSTQPQPPLLQYYGVDLPRGFDQFGDPGSIGQVIPYPYNNNQLGYENQGFY